jgi:hypothetical protein
LNRRPARPNFPIITAPKEDAMTNEERDIISQFVSRVGGQPVQQASGFGGSVPATIPAQNLPPVDPEADRFIADQFAQHP